MIKVLGNELLGYCLGKPEVSESQACRSLAVALVWASARRLRERSSCLFLFFIFIYFWRSPKRKWRWIWHGSTIVINYYCNPWRRQVLTRFEPCVRAV